MGSDKFSVSPFKQSQYAGITDLYVKDVNAALLHLKYILLVRLRKNLLEIDHDAKTSGVTLF
jgi:hypothetical protein